jgi:hypothetical protein
MGDSSGPTWRPSANAVHVVCAASRSCDDVLRLVVATGMSPLFLYVSSPSGSAYGKAILSG